MEKHVCGTMMNNDKNMVRESISKMKSGKAAGSSVFYIYIYIYFDLRFGCPMANFEALSRGQLSSPDVNLSVILVSTRRSAEAS